MSDEKIKKQIKSIAGKYLEGMDYKIFIFGSRATDQYRAFSDFDLGILSDKKIPGHTMVKIRTDLEDSAIPYKIDVVDFKCVSDEFSDLALAKAKYL